MVKKNLSELISKVVYPGFPWKGRPHAYPELPHYLARSSSNQSILHLIVASCHLEYMIEAFCSVFVLYTRIGAVNGTAVIHRPAKRYIIL